MDKKVDDLRERLRNALGGTQPVSERDLLKLILEVLMKIESKMGW